MSGVHYCGMCDAILLEEFKYCPDCGRVNLYFRRSALIAEAIEHGVSEIDMDCIPMCQWYGNLHLSMQSSAGFYFCPHCKETLAMKLCINGVWAKYNLASFLY
jgi:predicted RNA-binding Zn-ribbon protein involved in translation (DUF1610 family)